MNIRLTVILLMLIVSPARGIVDPSPDVIGIYFDENAMSVEANVPANSPFSLFAVLPPPTETEVTGFEFGYAFVPPTTFAGMVIRLATHYPPGIIIIDPPLDPLTGSYSINLPVPLPAADAVVLMGWQYMLLGNFSVHFNLGPADPGMIPGGMPGYWSLQGVVPTDLAETCFGTGARANEFCPLALEPHSFGRMKCLYR